MKVVEDGIPNVFVNGPIFAVRNGDLMYITAYTTRPSITYGSPVTDEAEAGVVARWTMSVRTYEDFIAAGHAMLASS